MEANNNSDLSKTHSTEELKVSSDFDFFEKQKAELEMMSERYHMERKRRDPNYTRPERQEYKPDPNWNLERAIEDLEKLRQDSLARVERDRKEEEEFMKQFYKSLEYEPLFTREDMAEWSDFTLDKNDKKNKSPNSVSFASNQLGREAMSFTRNEEQGRGPHFVFSMEAS